MKKNKSVIALVTIGVLLSITIISKLEINLEPTIDQTESDIDVANYLFRMIRTKTGNEEISINPNEKVLQYYLSHSQARSTNEEIEWIERGPANVGGRMRSIIVDKNDDSNSTWIAGSASGGIWKTTDAGNSWTEVSTGLPNLSVVTIAQSESNPAVLYAGSGEGALGGGLADGYGIFKSTDGGNTWTLLESTSITQSDDFVNSNRVIVNPFNENDVLAATSNGVDGSLASSLMRSLDGGVSWEKIWEPDSRILQVIPHPHSFDTIYASVLFRGVAVSTDGGETFSYSNLDDIVNSSGGVAGRTELAISPTSPNIMYASVGYVNRTGSGLYRSENDGFTWTLVSDPNQPGDLDYLLQGEYDNCITVNPFNPNEVFWGGVSLYKASVGENIVEGNPTYLGTEENGTSDFLSFINFNNGTHFQNRLAIKNVSNTPSLEIRFGPGKSQLAHRFQVPVGGNAGVPANNYSYIDYVEVPFEVWDIESNRQLMVSFRDQERNSAFNLNERDPDDEDLADNREYLYIHSLTYDSSPSEEIAVNGGQEISQYLFFWPTLTPGITWNPENLPESTLKIKFGPLVFNESVINQLTGIVHPDHHYLTTIITSENSFKLLSVNDGGVASSTNAGATFMEHETGLNTTQFYSAVKMPKESHYLGGTQDNDVLMSAVANPGKTTSYKEQHPTQLADGFEVLWHRRNENNILISYQRNVIHKSTDGGDSYQLATNGLDDSGFSNAQAPFITRLSNSYLSPNTVFAVSSSGIWKSPNFGDSWELSTINTSNNNSWGGFLDVEVSDIDSKIVWAGGAMDENRNIFVSTDRGDTFKPVSKYEMPLGNITSIVPHPTNPMAAFLLFSQYESPKILKTTDLGKTWEDLSGFGTNNVSSNGFPDVATFSLIVFPDNDKIWVGTELGIYETLDGGSSWNPLESNLPKVLIFDMKVFEGELVVASFGRGIWTVNLDLEYPYEQILSSSETDRSLNIYPNLVTNGQIQITNISDDVKSCSIHSINGMEIKKIKVHSDSMKLDVSHLIPGIYIFHFESKSGSRASRKIIVK